MTADDSPLLEARGVSKHFGNVVALRDVSARVHAGEVTCVLGDNGAGKSTFIKILSGVHQHDGGELFVAGRPRRFHSPQEARDAGIATVYQDLAMIPLMPIWRNFFLGAEPTRWVWPFRRFDVETAKRLSRQELERFGIDVGRTDRPVSTLSGGERQAVATARAVYFGARVLILDEPTAALGVRQVGVVLRYVRRARDQGVGVIFISHNPAHAHLVGDRFVLLNRGRVVGDFGRDDISRDDLIREMSGGAELDQIQHEVDELTAE
ncbi:MAG: sugar ABC transporter ATP-binding protein [Streptosporangiales bacterium]|nr:sugar ABC transporter ATP-binding protein [Streptosporangiales bacterium]MBO0889919.1 sugar ABC transporter ATP-binding protein [Acidothermales bacterium]